MPAVVNACIMLFAAWCFIEAAISLWIIKTWGKPYHSDELNQIHRAMSARDHRSLKLMHARHAVGWILGGCVAAWYAYGNS